MTIPKPRELEIYEASDGTCPFEDWLNSLKDITARALIRKRLTRIRLGNMVKTRNLRDGVWELKIKFGPGYRVYYGEDGPKIIVLLIGGDKGSQQRDIQKAKKYWEDYCA